MHNLVLFVFFVSVSRCDGCPFCFRCLCFGPRKWMFTKACWGFRTPGGSYLGDVNISAILDSFSVSYDKRVRPNYGGEYLWIVLPIFFFFFLVMCERPGHSCAMSICFWRALLSPDWLYQGGAWSMVWVGLPSDAQHLSRPPFCSQPLNGRCRPGFKTKHHVRTLIRIQLLSCDPSKGACESRMTQTTQK